MRDDEYDPWPEIAPDLIARLNERQRRFAQAYLNTANWNATRAAQLAGDPWPRQQGPRLTSFPAVKAVIEEGFRIYVARRASERRRRWARG